MMINLFIIIDAMDIVWRQSTIFKWFDGRRNIKRFQFLFYTLLKMFLKYDTSNVFWRYITDLFVFYKDTRTLNFLKNVLSNITFMIYPLYNISSFTSYIIDHRMVYWLQWILIQLIEVFEYTDWILCYKIRSYLPIELFLQHILWNIRRLGYQQESRTLQGTQIVLK